MAFDYEAAKAQYGAQRARQMEQEAASAPVPTPAVPAGPTNFPPPPGAKTAAPAPAPSGPPPGEDFNSWFQRANAAGGGNFDPNAAETQAQYQQHLFTLGGTGGGGMGSDNADYSKQGDSTGMRAYAQQNGMSEDFARFSEAQLKSWEPRKDSNCPPKTPYQAFDGSGCVEKPIDSNKGAGGAGGGAGGAGGGGSVGTAATSGGGAGSDLAAQIEQVLKNGLSGADSRYNSQAMQGLLAQIKQNVESQRKTQIRQADESAASRGMSRSGAAGVNEAKINAAAGASFTNQYADVLKAKIDADYQDKMGALDRSQKYLDSLRDEMYRRDMSAIQQQQFKANLDLAYANIKAQRDALASQQQYGKDMLAAQYGYGATFGG